MNQPRQAHGPHAWSFASGRAAVLEARMLTDGFFESVLEAEGLEGVLTRLGETALGGAFAGTEDLARTDELAREHYVGLTEDLRRWSPTEDVLDLLALPLALRSFKSFVKREMMGLDVAPVASPYDDGAWDELWRDQAPELPVALRKAAQAAREVVRAHPERPERLDEAIDSLSLTLLCEAAAATGSAWIAGYHRRYARARSVEMFLRAQAREGAEDAAPPPPADVESRSLLAELEGRPQEEWPQLLAYRMDGLSTDGMAAAQGLARAREFARAADAWLMTFAREAKRVPFGPERVFGCALGLEAERYNVTLAVGGRAAGIEPDVLRAPESVLHLTGSSHGTRSQDRRDRTGAGDGRPGERRHRARAGRERGRTRAGVGAAGRR